MLHNQLEPLHSAPSSAVRQKWRCCSWCSTCTRPEKGIGAVSKLHQKFVECSLVHKFCTIFAQFLRPPTAFAAGTLFHQDGGWAMAETKTGGLPSDKSFQICFLWQLFPHQSCIGQLPLCRMHLSLQCWLLRINIHPTTMLTVYAVNIVDLPCRRCLSGFEDSVTAERPISLSACLLVSRGTTTTPLTPTNTTSHCAEWATCPPPLCAIPEGCSGDRWGGWQPSHGL